MQTEIGQIAGMIRGTEEDLTPLQKRLKGLGRWLIVLCLVIVAAVVGTGIVSRLLDLSNVPDRGHPRRCRHPRGTTCGGDHCTGGGEFSG